MYVMHKFGALLFVFCLIGAPTAHQKIHRTTKVQVLLWVLYDSGGSKIAYSKKQFLPIIEQQEVV